MLPFSSQFCHSFLFFCLIIKYSSCSLIVAANQSRNSTNICWWGFKARPFNCIRVALIFLSNLRLPLRIPFQLSSPCDSGGAVLNSRSPLTIRARLFPLFNFSRALLLVFLKADTLNNRVPLDQELQRGHQKNKR